METFNLLFNNLNTDLFSPVTILVAVCILLLFQAYFLVSIIFTRRLTGGMITVVATTVTVLLIWNSIPNIFGWPYKTNSLPEKFEVITHKEYFKKKEIVLWILPKGSDIPRSYRIEDDPALRKQLRKVKRFGAEHYVFVKKMEGTEEQSIDVETSRYDLRLKTKPRGTPLKQGNQR